LIAVAATMLCAAMLLPRVALAESTVTPLVVGESTPGTLTLTAGDNTYRAEYSVYLRAGQTLAATYTPSASITEAAITMWAPFATEIGTLGRHSEAPNSPISMFLLAPRTATYRLKVLGRSTPGTYTIDTAIVPALAYSLSPMGAPTHAMRNTWFKVTATLFGTPDQLAVPVRFVVQRKSGRWWRTYRIVKPLFGRADIDRAGPVSYRASLKLPKGTYRVRAVFSDAGHSAPQRNAWRTITVNGVNLTKLPSGMGPRTALRTYLQAILDERYADAYALLPRDKQRAYGSAQAYAAQVKAYGVTGYKMGPSRQKGSEVTIVCQQDTPQMAITYTWTYVRIEGSWYVKSRVMGGTL
jgi:hypothetical protein